MLVCYVCSLDTYSLNEVIISLLIRWPNSLCHYTSLVQLIKDSDLVCPECAAPLIRRESYTIFGESGGREVEADVGYVEYECGLSINHEDESSLCRNRNP
jgi:hypothetical protein